MTKKILAIGVVPPGGSKGDLAQYRASVDQLKKIGSVRLSYPGARRGSSAFFSDVDLLPHPFELALSKNLYPPLSRRLASSGGANSPSKGMKMLSKMFSFYDSSFSLKTTSLLLTKPLYSQLHADFNDNDLAVILGHTLERSLLSTYATTYSYPKFILNMPTFMFPFSVSQLGLKESPGRMVSLIKLILRRIDLLSLREERSYHYLAEILGSPQNLLQAADLAFLLSEASRSNVVSKLRKAGVDLERPSVACALRSDYFLTYPIRYGPARLVSFLKKIAETLDRLIADFDVSIYFLPMTILPDTSGSDDLKVSKACLRYMANQEKARIVDLSELNAYEVKTLLGLMDFLITSRLHAGILAMSKHVPTVMMLPARDNKAIGLAERLGVKEYFIDLDTTLEAGVNQLYRAISEAFTQRDAIQGILATTISREKKLAALPMAVLGRV